MSRRSTGNTGHEAVRDPLSVAARGRAIPPLLPLMPKGRPTRPSSLTVAAGTGAVRVGGQSTLEPPLTQLVNKESWWDKLREKIRVRRAARDANLAASSGHGTSEGGRPEKGKGKGKDKHLKGKPRYLGIYVQ